MVACPPVSKSVEFVEEDEVDVFECEGILDRKVSVSVPRVENMSYFERLLDSLKSESVGALWCEHIAVIPDVSVDCCRLSDPCELVQCLCDATGSKCVGTA